MVLSHLVQRNRLWRNIRAVQGLHGVKPVSAGRNGEFHFAVINFIKAIENAQTFAGRNKYPILKPWSTMQAERILIASGKLQDTFWKLDRAAELFDDARRKFVDFKPPTMTVEEIVATQQARSTASIPP